MSAPETILSIWERVLGPIGPREADSFFLLGGDAVAASEMLSLVSDACGVEIDLTSFLASPTVSELSRMVDERQHVRFATDPQTAPLAFSQEGMLWHEQFAPGSFNLPPLVRRYQGQLDGAALRRALSDIVGRHAPLRTTVYLRGGRPVQRIRPPKPLDLPSTDLTGVDPEVQRAAVGQAVALATSHPFDLADGVLFEPHLFKLSDRDHVLLIRLHHLAFDDWSVDIFRRELSTLYRAHAAGENPKLPELRVEFAEFCRRQRRRLAGVAGSRELAYWRRELAGAPLSVPLPLGDPARPEGSRYPSAVPLNRLLPRQLVQPLRALARQQRSSLFMGLLAVFAVVVHGYTGQEDLVMASVVANRTTADAEALIACFTKKIPLRLRFSGDSPLLEVMTAARNTVLGALANQDLGFETVVQDVLGPDAASFGVVPDISVMFQADTPHNDRLVLPGLTVGTFDTGSTARQPHFASGDAAEPQDERPVWGAGVYQGTFLILSVVESQEGVMLVARGAFHPPAVEGILDRFEAVLADVVTDPAKTVSQLSASAVHQRHVHGDGSVRDAGVSVRGFLVQPGRIEAALCRYPGIREAAVEIREASSSAVSVVAYIVLDGTAAAPTLAEVRAHLWSTLPGYVWPTSVVAVAALPRAEEGEAGIHELPAEDSSAVRAVNTSATSDEQILKTLWADVLGGGPIAGDANYWQKFSFVEVLRRAKISNVDIRDEQVTRNRTLKTLAADVAATRSSK